jgi:hypothetical protein
MTAVVRQERGDVSPELPGSGGMGGNGLRAARKRHPRRLAPRAKILRGGHVKGLRHQRLGELGPVVSVNDRAVIVALDCGHAGAWLCSARYAISTSSSASRLGPSIITARVSPSL